MFARPGWPITGGHGGLETGGGEVNQRRGCRGGFVNEAGRCRWYSQLGRCPCTGGHHQRASVAQGRGTVQLHKRKLTGYPGWGGVREGVGRGKGEILRLQNVLMVGR